MTCKTLSKQTKDTIKKVSTKVTMVSSNNNHKAASTPLPLRLTKNRSRVFSTYDSINDTGIRAKSALSAVLIIKLTDLKSTSVDKYQMPGLAPTADEEFGQKIIFSVMISLPQVSRGRKLYCLRRHTVWMICTTAAFSFTTTRRVNF